MKPIAEFPYPWPGRLSLATIPMALGFRIASEEEAVLLNDREDPLHKVISKQQRRAGNVQVALLCWAFFLIGWGDGSTGPLIPSIQTDYMVSAKSRSRHGYS